MYQPTEKIWMDGKLVPWGDANVHIMTHSLHYGVGAFEGIRYYNTERGPALFRLGDHLRRFEESVKIVALKLPFTATQLRDGCLELLRICGLKEGYVRPLAFISEGPNVGLWAYDNPVRVAMVTYGWGAYLGKDALKDGVRTKISSYTRLHRNTNFTKGKITGQYVNSVLAKREARVGGFDEAILLDPEGYVAEGSGENIFIVRDGVIKTPTLGAILRGITRDTVITLAKNEGMPLIEEGLTRDDLYVADEIFFTGTAAEITPIREIDHRQIGKGVPGPITRKLQQLYTDVVYGRVPKYREWLTPISG